MSKATMTKRAATVAIYGTIGLVNLAVGGWIAGTVAAWFLFLAVSEAHG